MNRKILFVVEGPAEKSELTNSFLHHLGISKEEYQIYRYNTSIHELYDLLTKPENSDIYLTSILVTNNKIDVKANYQVDSTFTSIYLIFDFDPQYHKYDDEKIKYLAKRFDNETEEGLLILNYPMFESIFDIEPNESKDDFCNKKIGRCSSGEYKKLVAKRTCFRSDTKHPYKHLYRREDIQLCCSFNLFKHLKLLNITSYYGIETAKILNLQIESLNKDNTIYVLNTMVLLYYDYNNGLTDIS